jgi:hypothetical protein
VRAPAAAELLEVWERSAAFGPPERADALLMLALPGEPAAAPPLGERNARLLELRELLFGGELEGLAACPDCGEAVEYSLSAETLRGGDVEVGADLLTLAEDGWEISFRLPTGDDLRAAASAGDVDGARLALLERCVVSAVAGGREQPAFRLPEHVVAALGERLAAADPQAETLLSLTCPACGGAWSIAFDAGAWLWTELESWARRTVLDVHALASAYGWSEAEILALGPRRELYLELVQA